jgi:hypothetical protein
MHANVKHNLAMQLAGQLSAKYLANYEAYRRECETPERNASGQRLRVHYCEHGTNQWTDYDNICPGCENGLTMADGLQRRRRALAEAKERVEQISRLVDAWCNPEFRGLWDEGAVGRRIDALASID